MKKFNFHADHSLMKDEKTTKSAGAAVRNIRQTAEFDTSRPHYHSFDDLQQTSHVRFTVVRHVSAVRRRSRGDGN